MSTSPKTILITGASAGMGKEMARALAERGHTVYGAARRVDRMKDLEAVGVRPIALDVTDDAQCEACIERIASETAGVDVLINNAGFGLFGAVEDLPLEEAHRQFDVNYFGVTRMTKLVLPRMRERGSGRVITITSIGGKIYTPLGAHYQATKHALEAWSDCLRLETKPFGIDVVVVEPGAIETEFGDVVAAPLLEHSGEGAYKDLAHKVADLTRAEYEPGKASPPSVVVKAVVHAVESARPRIRYAIGKYASMIKVRKWFGDRVFDRLMMSRF